jgi:hypothetical protein
MRPSFMRAPIVAASCAAACALAGACGPSFSPGSLITNERVLAVVADPPEAVPGRSVTLTPLIASPDGNVSLAGDADDDEDPRGEWWRCPDTDSDALGDYAQCTVPAARRAVGVGPSYVDTVPLDLFGEPPAPGEEATLKSDKAIGALLGYWRVVGFTMEAGKRRVDAFKRVPVYLPVRLDSIDPQLGELDARINAQGELEENTNPVLSAVLVREGTPDGPAVTRIKKGGTYFFDPIFDERALQEYFSLQVDFTGLDLTDPEALAELPMEDLLARFERVQRCEVPTFNWYVTAGKVRREITLDEGVIQRVFDPRGVPCPPVEGDVRIPEAEYTAPSGADDDDVGDALPDGDVIRAWVVMRDGRGGTATRSFDFTLE